MYEDRESSVIQYRSYRAIRPREIDREDSFSLRLVHSTTVIYVNTLIKMEHMINTI